MISNTQGSFLAHNSDFKAANSPMQTSVNITLKITYLNSTLYKRSLIEHLRPQHELTTRRPRGKNHCATRRRAGAHEARMLHHSLGLHQARSVPSKSLATRRRSIEIERKNMIKNIALHT